MEARARRLILARPELADSGWRIGRAIRLVKAGMVSLLGGGRARVHSQSGPQSYDVDIAGRSCTCPDAADHTCKHQLAALIASL